MSQFNGGREIETMYEYRRRSRLEELHDPRANTITAGIFQRCNRYKERRTGSMSSKQNEIQNVNILTFTLDKELSLIHI